MSDDENKPVAAAGAFIKLSETDLTKFRNLINLEPDLSQIVKEKQAWATVWTTVKNIAIGLSVMSGGFVVLREILKGLRP